MSQASYYNTTNEVNTAPLEKKAHNQEQEILSYMMKLKGNAFTASFIYRAFNITPHYPITSVRRALHNLQKQGKIKRHGTKVKGMYGRNEYLYYICE